MADIIIARRIHSGTLNVSYPCTCIANDVMEISSKLVREKIAAGTAWRSLVPAAARTIIEARCLYGQHPQPAESGFRPDRSPDKSLVLRVEEAARESLGFERFLHSRNTALLAWDMCRRLSAKHPELAYHLNPDLGYLAGIGHDLGKQLSEKELFKLVNNDGRGISDLVKEKPWLLPGRAAAVLLRERFNVHNKAVLEAVALHTAGSKNMGPLAKVVYIADKMEVSREKGDVSMKKLVYSGDDLDIMFVTVLENTVSWIYSKKLKLSEDTLKLLEKSRRIS
jgi:nicotinate-nucleotide adenylyltransferase